MIDFINHAVSEIQSHWKDRLWWHQRLAVRGAGPIIDRTYGKPGIDYMNEDWDNLLILDACRADMFEETIDTTQFNEYQSVHSVGTSSPDWLEKTFKGKRYPDTVYVTANPWIAKVSTDTFAEVYNIWVENYDISAAELADAGLLEHVGLDEIGTIPANVVNEFAKNAHKQHPNKRLIIHYFQPHDPCIGRPDGSHREEVPDNLTPGRELWNGEVKKEDVWNAYTDNLKYVVHHAKELAKSIGGRSVLTSDHGELFGEWLFPLPIRGYGHPSGLRHPKLTEVPWAVLDKEPRRSIVEDDISIQQTNTDEINERLKNLGYKV